MRTVRSATLCTILATLALPTSGLHAADWPQWRGPERTGRSPETGLMQSWPDAGPPVEWQVDSVGTGFASVAIADGRVYTQGNLDGVEHVICLSEEDGSVLWTTAPRPDREGYTNNRGDGPRGMPVVDGNRVYVEGGRGDVSCLNARTGELLWTVNLVEDLGGRVPTWGYSESPLVVGQVIVVTPGGDRGTVATLHKRTGEVIWQSRGLTQQAGYSSPRIARLAGQRQLVQFASESCFGLSLNGEVLWQYSRANNGTANIATPVLWDDYVFVSSAYGTGGGLVKIHKRNNELRAREVYFSQELANHHGGIVKVGDHLYGFGGGVLYCLDATTGERAWRNRSVGKGSLIYADGHLYCLSENHRMGLVEATPDGYREKGRFEIESFGRPSWAHPAIANGTLYIRNQHRLTAYDIRAKNASAE